MAESLIRAVWYSNVDEPPDKFVVLADTNGKDSDIVMRPFKEQLQGRIERAAVQFAYAQQHLEAWFFGDAANLRSWLGGKALGSVDASSRMRSRIRSCI